MKKEETTESKIIEAARRVFYSKGLHGARMQDIADQAGINKALLHYYFRSKDQLFEGVFREALQRVFPRFEELWSSGKPLAEKIKLFVDGYLDVLTEHPFLPAFVLHEINQDPDQFQRLFFPKTAISQNKKFLQQVKEEIQKGKIRRIDPRQLMVNLMSLCIFPFAARPLICKMMGMSEKDFLQFIQQRKQVITELIVQSIKTK